MLGVDDGRFVAKSHDSVLVVGVVFRGGHWIDGVLSTTITVDGYDATEKISKMILKSIFYRQLKVVFLNGITVGGFNVVDIDSLNQSTGLPIISVNQKKPSLDDVRQALTNLPGYKERWHAVMNAGPIFSMRAPRGKGEVYIEMAGTSKEEVQDFLNLTSTRSNIPEALRVAHLIASNITSVNEE